MEVRVQVKLIMKQWGGVELMLTVLDIAEQKGQDTQGAYKQVWTAGQHTFRIGP